jgi:hypothetical protein
MTTKDRRMAKFTKSNALSACNIKMKKTKRLIIADDFLEKIKEQVRKIKKTISKKKKKIIRILEGGIVKKIRSKRENKIERKAIFNIQVFLRILLFI